MALLGVSWVLGIIVGTTGLGLDGGLMRSEAISVAINSGIKALGMHFLALAFTSCKVLWQFV